MPSESGILRRELAALYAKYLRLEEFCKSMLDVCGKALTLQVEMTERERRRADRLQEKVSALEKRLGIQNSWNGRPSESKEHVQSRAEFRAEVQEYEAAKDGRGSDGKCSDGKAKIPAAKKSIGGQPGHTGVSRNDKCDDTIYFKADMCLSCGGTGAWTRQSACARGCLARTGTACPAATCMCHSTCGAAAAKQSRSRILGPSRDPRSWQGSGQ